MNDSAGPDRSTDAPVAAGPDLACELPELFRWSAAPSQAELAGLPACPALLAFLSETGEVIQLLTTQHLRRCVEARLRETAAPRSKRARIETIARAVRWRPIHGPFEGRWRFYRAARRLYPHDYRRRIAFGPTWMLRVDFAARVPDIEVSERIWCEPGEWLGFWPTQRSAQQALEGLWDRFDLCRYPQQVRRAPAGQRCAYADMGRCDAPCDGSAALSVYVQRVKAAWRFACGKRDEWLDLARRQMNAAADAQHYELAAQIRKQIETASHWAAGSAGDVRLLGGLRYVLALPVTRRRAWKLFVFDRGRLQEGTVVVDNALEAAIAAIGSAHSSVDASAPPADARAAASDTAELDPIVRMEQTWLLAHLLAHRERASALVAPWPEGTDASTLAAALATERRRSAEQSAARRLRPDAAP